VLGRTWLYHSTRKLHHAWDLKSHLGGPLRSHNPSGPLTLFVEIADVPSVSSIGVAAE